MLALSLLYEEDRKVLTLNEPQVWTVIGVFVTALFGLLGFVTTSLTRTIRTEIGSIRTELASEIGSVRGEIGTVRGEIGNVRGEIGSVRNELGSLRNEMNARFDSLSSRIDHIDRDVQFLMKREIEDRP